MLEVPTNAHAAQRLLSEVRRAISNAVRVDEEKRVRGPAKAFAIRLGSSLLVIALLAPIFALSMIAGGRVGVLVESIGNEWFLIALAFGGAAASAVNGLGRSNRRSQASRNTKRALVNQRGSHA